MSRASKARIKIPHGDTGQGPTTPAPVIITGSVEQIEMAKALIEEKVAEDQAFRAKTQETASRRTWQAKKRIQKQPDSDGDGGMYS